MGAKVVFYRVYLSRRPLKQVKDVHESWKGPVMIPLTKPLGGRDEESKAVVGSHRGGEWQAG